MQGTLKLDKKDAPKVKVAAHYAGVELSNPIEVGDTLRTDVKFKSAQDLWDMAQLITKVTGTEPIQVKEPKKKAETPVKK